jgi:hypothetical protein
MNSMNANDLMIRFRQMPPFQQTAILGLVIFLIYEVYAILVLHLEAVEATSESMYNTTIFIVVYYFATVVILKKNIQSKTQLKGPKKGLRGK